MMYKALCDQGSGVNLMPLSIENRLGMLNDMKSTQVTLQLADRSLVKLTGVIEDIWVGVGKLILPADFIILDIVEDKEVPLILGRPFMATGDAWLDVKDKVVVFQVNGEQVIFNLDRAMKRPREEEEDFSVGEVDVIRSCVLDVWQEEEENELEDL